MSQLPASPFPKRGISGPGKETFLAPSADKQTEEGDVYGATGVPRESPTCSNFKYICIYNKAVFTSCTGTVIINIKQDHKPCFPSDVGEGFFEQKVDFF